MNWQKHGGKIRDTFVTPMQEEEEVEEKGQEENDTSFFGWPPAPDLLVPLLLVLVLLLLTILLAWLLHRLVHLENIVAEYLIAHQAEKEKRQTGAAEARIVSSSQADHLGRYRVLCTLCSSNYLILSSLSISNIFTFPFTWQPA